MSRADAIRRLAENPGATPGERAAARAALERLAARGEHPKPGEKEVESRTFATPTEAERGLAVGVAREAGCRAFGVNRDQSRAKFVGHSDEVLFAIGLWRALLPELARVQLSAGLGFVWGRFPPAAPGGDAPKLDLDTGAVRAGAAAGRDLVPKLEGT